MTEQFTTSPEWKPVREEKRIESIAIYDTQTKTSEFHAVWHKPDLVSVLVAGVVDAATGLAP